MFPFDNTSKKNELLDLLIPPEYFLRSMVYIRFCLYWKNTAPIKFVFMQLGEQIICSTLEQQFHMILRTKAVLCSLNSNLQHANTTAEKNHIICFTSQTLNYEQTNYQDTTNIWDRTPATWNLINLSQLSIYHRRGT